MSQEQQQDDVIPHGEQIVERFGGIRPMASKLNVPVTTVQGWKKRDAIPAIRRDEILSAAASHDIDLKGLITAANENNHAGYSGGIAEDPALTARPAQPASAAPQAQTAARPQPQNQTRAQSQSRTFDADLHLVRKTARRTSLYTTVGLLALVGGVGFLLFGGTQTMPDGARIGVLENRVSTLEAGARSNTTEAAAPGMFDTLQQRVDDLTTVIGSSRETLSQMAETISAGTGMPLAQRLAMLEQQVMSGGGAAALAPMLESVPGMMNGGANAFAGNGDMQAAIADLRNIIAGLQGRTDNLDAALAQAQTENDALGRSLEDVSSRDLGAAAMLLTLSQLRNSMNRQTPLADDLELLRNVAGDADPALTESIDRMAPYAESGVLTPQGLKRELQLAANDIVTAKLKGEDVSMKEKIMGRLENLFSVKKDGMPVSGGEEQALINTASAQLDAGDVQGAMNTLNQLQGPAADAAAPWQTQAAATLAAKALDMNIVNTLMAKLKSAAAGATASGGLTGVTNAGPINMAPQVAPQPVPQDASPFAEPAPDIQDPVLVPAPEEPTMTMPGQNNLPDVIQQ